MDIETECAAVLGENGFRTARTSATGKSTLVFEDATVLGFVFAYPSVDSLVRSWRADSDAAISRFQLNLRVAGKKAWNTYMVLLAEESDGTATRLNAIEEDLAGTRKVARAGMVTRSDIQVALLPLLRIQAAPVLGAIDIVKEIRLRTTDLPARAMDAFFASADDSTLLRLLEEPV